MPGVRPGASARCRRRRRSSPPSTRSTTRRATRRSGGSRRAATPAGDARPGRARTPRAASPWCAATSSGCATRRRPPGGRGGRRGRGQHARRGHGHRGAGRRRRPRAAGGGPAGRRRGVGGLRDLPRRDRGIRHRSRGRGRTCRRTRCWGRRRTSPPGSASSAKGGMGAGLARHPANRPSCGSARRSRRRLASCTPGRRRGSRPWPGRAQPGHAGFERRAGPLRPGRRRRVRPGGRPRSLLHAASRVGQARPPPTGRGRGGRSRPSRAAGMTAS